MYVHIRFTMFLLFCFQNSCDLSLKPIQSTDSQPSLIADIFVKKLEISLTRNLSTVLGSTNTQLNIT